MENKIKTKTGKKASIFIALCFFLFISLIATHTFALTAQEYIDSGETALFLNTLAGAQQAHTTFQSGIAEHPSDPVINAYLGLSRLIDLAMDEGSGGLTGVLAEYGITRTGTDLETLEFILPEYNDHILLPETAPSAETVRSFLGGPFLTAVNASIANLDVTIANWTDTDKHIIDMDKTGGLADTEVDLGDIYLFRASLKTMKALVLLISSYNLSLDVREIVALMNIDVLEHNLKNLFDRYPNAFNLLTNASTPSVNGAAQLGQARLALLGAIADYLAASEKIRNDPGTALGAEELIEVDPNDYQETLFRENLTKLQTSLTGGTAAADLVLERVETAYEVYGGSTFTTNETNWMDKGYHPDYYGYTYLGSATDTHTFNGTYAYYIIVSRPGNMAPVDTVQGSNGNYFGTTIVGNVLNWGNIGGAPDTAYALVNAEGGGDSGGFIVIQPQTSISSITVVLHNPAAIAYEEILSLNLNPLFGNNSGPYNLRDFLPQFSDCQDMVYGTVGYGLNPSEPDATLGGILPGWTQDDWGLEYAATGNISIPTATIDVQDASLADWTAISPVFTDATGEINSDLSGADIQHLYLAKDDTFLYGRMTLFDGPPNTNVMSNPWQVLAYFVQFRTGLNEFYGSRVIQVDYSEQGAWRVQVWERGATDQLTYQVVYDSGYAQAVGNDLEWKVPLSNLGPLNGRFLSNWTHWIPFAPDPIDSNETCMRLEPMAAINVNVSVPQFDGTGPVYIGVYPFSGTLNFDPQSLIGGQVIFPDEYADGTYVINNLPVGLNVIAVVRWDADYNGVEPNDYMAAAGPLTVAGDGSTTFNLTTTTLAGGSLGQPYFRQCNVQAYNTSGGVSTSLLATVVDPDGSAPQTISALTVTGPQGFSYSFTPADIWSGNTFWAGPAGPPAVGEYIFTATDSDGKTATSRYDYSGGSVIPLPATATLQASGNLLTPTLSWGGINGYNGNLFYRVRIFENPNQNVVWTSDLTTNTVMPVPSGILAVDKTYKWRVEALDNYDFAASNNRSASDSVDLTLDNETPFFAYAMVYSRRDSDGQFYTALEPKVVDPDGTVPGSIQSLTVTDPNNNNYTLNSSNFLSQFQEYYKTISGQQPVDGIYKFTVVDINGHSKTSYDYVKVHDVPAVDSATLQASGDPLAPTLSWSVPAGIDRSLYFRVIIEKLDGSWAWASSRIPLTQLSVPSGILQNGVSYQWYVRTIDDQNFGHFSNQARSAKVPLTIDNSTPYFTSVHVYQRHEPDGLYTIFDVIVIDPNGTVPGSIQSLTVSGPSSFSYTFTAQDFPNNDPTWLGYVKKYSGLLAEGVYTFTVTDNENKTAVGRAYLKPVTAIPAFDPTTFQISGDPLAPTVSWSGITGYGGQLYYRIWAEDLMGNVIYQIPKAREPYTSFTVPNGAFQANTIYKIRVEANDHYNWIIYNARRNSDFMVWFTGGSTSPTISGHVYEVDGQTPIPNIYVYAVDYDTEQWTAGVNTNQQGFYTMIIPAGTYRIGTCASCSGLSYMDEFYNEACNYANAQSVTVSDAVDTPDIDFTLAGKLQRTTVGDAVTAGIAWLAGVQKQDGSGSWGTQHALAKTALAVLNLEAYATNQSISPFDAGYAYQANVQSGLDYIFGHAYIQNIGLQTHGNPDTDGDGLGVYFDLPGDYTHSLVMYNTSISMMALAASNAPNRVVDVAGSPVNGWTYAQVMQDAVDYLAWSQTDSGVDRGGWSYQPMDNSGGGSDQSNSGWVTLALAYAEAQPPIGFGLTIPGFVISELNLWIDSIQDDVNGDAHDGGAYYSNNSDPLEANVLRTGNLLQQMGFAGDTATKQRVQDAVDYLIRHWDTEWQGSPVCYQTTYTVMKGLESLEIDTIDSINWFQDFTTKLLSEQSLPGWWPSSCFDDCEGILSTEWALLTLQKIQPPPVEKPDLVIVDQSLEWVNQGAGTYKVYYTVKNVGNITAAAGQDVDLTIDGASYASLSIPEALGPNQVYNGFFEVQLSGDEDNITICADINGEVAERFEDNNCETSIMPPHIMGDVNRDGNVDLVDAILVLKVLVGIEPAGLDLGADVDADGRIGMAELIYILQDVGGLR